MLAPATPPANHCKRAALLLQALTEFFGNLNPDQFMDCLRELLVSNPQNNLQLVVNIAKEYSDTVGSAKIIELLEAHSSFPGMYMYLGARIHASTVREEARKFSCHNCCLPQNSILLGFGCQYSSKGAVALEGAWADGAGARKIWPALFYS